MQQLIKKCIIDINKESWSSLKNSKQIFTRKIMLNESENIERYIQKPTKKTQFRYATILPKWKPRNGIYVS